MNRIDSFTPARTAGETNSTSLRKARASSGSPSWNRVTWPNTAASWSARGRSAGTRETASPQACSMSAWNTSTSSSSLDEA